MRKAVLLAAFVGVIALTMTGIALADHDPPDGSAVAPAFVAGKTSNKCDGGQKLDGSADGGATGDLDSGTYAFDFGSFAGTITITVVQTSAGPTFTFVTDDPSHVITSIYVKGGPEGANFYDYGASGIAHDDGLHSPFNSNSGKWYGLSHICVFTDKK